MAPVSEIDQTQQEFNSLISDLNESRNEITISEYIYLRILQIGIKSIFGVPGDFNLSFLEHLYDIEGLNWIGCCNELNASYAADAYAKASKMMAVLVTTYGVGELSGINGIAGSYSEYSPVLHIVGTSALKKKKTSKVVNFHHLMSGPNSYTKPDHYVYEKMASYVSCINGSLEDNADEACDMVDNVIETIWKTSRPGYLFLPIDITELKVPVARLYNTLDLEYDSANENESDEVINRILNMLYSAKNPAVLVDAFVGKFRLEGLFQNFVKKLNGNVNIYDTFLGKGLIHEDNERYVGTYTGHLGDPSVTTAIESADFVLHLGIFDNEVNNGHFSFNLDKCSIVALGPDYASVGSSEYRNLNLQNLFTKLVQNLDTAKLVPAPKYNIDSLESLPELSDYKLSENDLFNCIQSHIQPNDILIVETCSFIFACHDLRLRGGKFINQMHWASIGYALPASLGASLALKDLKLPGKVISIEGDGSAQMSLQELSTILRYDVNPVLIILNNSGYTIERVIKGPHRSYNDISGNWQWTQMLKCFGDLTGERSESLQISTRSDLNKFMSSKQFHSLEKFQLIEMMLPKFDVPDRLLKMISGS